MFKPLPSLLAAVLTACALLLAGCNDAPETAAQKAATAAPISVEAIAAEAQGFVVGSQMSKRTVYIFFDAQCPHCAVLWESAKPLKSQAKFVWIPVGLLNAASTAQGATLLAAGDPIAAMDEHETSLKAGRGGISAGSNTDSKKDAVAKNTALLNRLGFTAIPSIVGTHAQTGAVVSREGALPTAALADLLGLQVPAAPAQ
ncbi:thioredoxin fold domain-containing protein [Polaromonas sp. YR568]|uniref:thioredoxin fold domain-containing protein n=1 Tax=Polaromonas sp. YR568 TaxID=1855301 RepID=UPI00398C1F20